MLAYIAVDKKGNWQWHGSLPTYAVEGFSVQAVDSADNMSEVASCLFDSPLELVTQG
ncbi:MAG: hypothetical protein Q9M28_12125 [Mariprofundaceae bacterium]|nr:hypothetical protein [Mariprofundaceae bacterium]